MTYSEIRSDSLLTSYQAGNLLQVNPSSINKWVEQGRIQAFRTPGGHRRIRAADLVRFLRNHGMPVPTELSRAGRIRLLLVDDDSKQLVAWQRVLKPFANRVDVRVADNGIEALLVVGSFRPHVVVLDVYMPEVDGIDVCRRLSANPQTRHIEMIVTSGQMTPQLEKQALAAGARRCLAKPVGLRDLLQAVGLEETAPALAAP